MAATRRSAAVITRLAHRPHASDIEGAFTRAGASTATAMNNEGSIRSHVTFTYPLEGGAGRAQTAMDVATRAASGFGQQCTRSLVEP